ncbi:1,4-alpha-glucan branching enzyme GlgB [Phycisphaerae bacterium RAS1]|nr:1,4-alpha-glucan branching enzyme GlgB [Phycisphaerae bacterium RAS1]
MKALGQSPPRMVPAASPESAAAALTLDPVCGAFRDMSKSVQGKVESDGTGLIALDPWLEPYADALRRRYARFTAKVAEILRHDGSLAHFARGHEHFGFNRGVRDGCPGVWYREWAPAASGLALIGDFNGWDRRGSPLSRDEFGVWSVFLPDDEYAARLVHESRVKVHVESAAGPMDRIPAYIRRVAYDSTGAHFAGQYWQPPRPYEWRCAAPPPMSAPRIYEAHVGMALEEQRVGSYREFEQHILPRIADAGYNAVQLMAIQEHPYYASFGYQVSSFFAPSSRFGTPEELKSLIDAAHGRGLCVFLDLVHSHSVKNVFDGLNRFDGTDFHYFHAGARGQHPVWDSLLFDYGKWEVLRFLLSNVRYWLEEFRFDGFRFDGVTSMLYTHHGFQRVFSSYEDYFGDAVDDDALVYLQLANRLAHEVNPAAITVAEDVSGMVGLARPLDEGGLGFDYRLAMGLPDYWVKLLERRDEDWQMGEMYGALTNRRRGEKHVAYAESHDQSLVGDKALAFRLMDAAMYWHMQKGSQELVIERGVALHKLIRLATFALGGEGYLNFMGNEFGHPEWIDFPREGNGWSFKHARRQWSLRDDPGLRYRDLAEFDKAMLALEQKFGILADDRMELLFAHEEHKLLVVRRGAVVFALNFHPTRSAADFRIGVPEATNYRVVLNTDDLWFGGHEIVRGGQIYPLSSGGDAGAASVQIYLPARTGQVLAPLRARAE